MNLSIVQLLCLYMHVYLFLSVFSFFIYNYIYTYIHAYIHTSMHTYIHTYICIYLYISLYICMLYRPLSVYYFLYPSGTFLAHVLRPNSFHRCSNFSSHCRSFTSLPQKRLRRHAHAFYFPACFQVQLTYFHIHVTFSFRSPPPGPQVVQLLPYCHVRELHCCTLLPGGNVAVCNAALAAGEEGLAGCASGAAYFMRSHGFRCLICPVKCKTGRKRRMLESGI